MKGRRADGSPPNPPKQIAVGDLCGPQPSLQQLGRGRRNISFASVTEGIVLGAADEGQHAAIGEGA